MVSFKDYVRDGEEVRVVEAKEIQVSTTLLFDINKKLEETLETGFINPYIGWIKIARVLSLYEMFLPKVFFRDIMEGEEILVIPTKDQDYYLHFQYSLDEEKGDAYIVNASIMSEETLEKFFELEETTE